MPFPYVDDLPKHLETERLLVKFPQVEDVDAVQAAVEESREHLKPWMPWWAQTRKGIAAYNLTSIEAVKARTDYPMRIWRKRDGLFIGSTGCHPRDTSVPSVEVGYWIRVSAVGQGYATEATRAAIRFAFDVLGAHRIEIRCDARNTASAAVAKRLGFVQEGCLRAQARTHHGDLRDTLVFGLLATDVGDKA